MIHLKALAVGLAVCAGCGVMFCVVFWLGHHVPIWIGMIPGTLVIAYAVGRKILEMNQ